MRLNKLILIFALFIPLIGSAQAVLVEDLGSARPNGSEHVKEESKKGSYLVESRRLRELFQGGEYESLSDLRSHRRVGIGVEGLGRLGMMGLDVEMNFGDMDSATAGIGGGPGYNGLSLGWKHFFGGMSVSPYAGFALSRWSSGGGSSIEGTTPRYLQDKFLTDEEKNTGKFGKNFFVPSIGLQYFELQGPSAGAALFAEILMLVDASTMDQAPTAALGALYYF